QGTMQMPGSEGGANWGGASFDPESEILYVKAINMPHLIRLKKWEIEPDKGIPPVSLAEMMRLKKKEYLTFEGRAIPLPVVANGIPITKPPYSVLTAIDMKTGDQVWQRPI